MSYTQKMAAEELFHEALLKQFKTETKYLEQRYSLDTSEYNNETLAAWHNFMRVCHGKEQIQ